MPCVEGDFRPRAGPIQNVNVETSSRPRGHKSTSERVANTQRQWTVSFFSMHSSTFTSCLPSPHSTEPDETAGLLSDLTTFQISVPYDTRSLHLLINPPRKTAPPRPALSLILRGLRSQSGPLTSLHRVGSIGLSSLSLLALSACSTTLSILLLHRRASLIVDLLGVYLAEHVYLTRSGCA